MRASNGVIQIQSVSTGSEKDDEGVQGVDLQVRLEGRRGRGKLERARGIKR